MGTHLTVPAWHTAHQHRLTLPWGERFTLWFATIRQTSKPLGIDKAEIDDVALQAFYELFARYQKPIADFLLRMTHDTEMAADLTQDTFLKAYSHINEIAEIGNVRAWIYRIAANTASNALRRRRRFTWVSLSELHAADLPDAPTGVTLIASGDLATSVVERDALEHALATLPPTARAALLLRATAGFEVAEIATMIGRSEASVRKMLYRAKEKLRLVLTERPDDAKGGW